MWAFFLLKKNFMNIVSQLQFMAYLKAHPKTYFYEGFGLGENCNSRMFKRESIIHKAE